MTLVKSPMQVLEEGKPTDPVYVLNTAMDSPYLGGVSGIVLLPIADAAGKTTTIIVQRTWLPQNLTEQVPRKQLLESISFRQSVESKRLIKILTQDEAMKILNRPGAKEERKRLESVLTYAKQTQSTRAQTNNFEVEVYDTTIPSSGNVVSEESVSKIRFDVFKEMLKDFTDIEALNAMKNRVKFTKVELETLKAELFEKPLCLKSINASLSKIKKK